MDRAEREALSTRKRGRFSGGHALIQSEPDSCENHEQETIFLFLFKKRLGENSVLEAAAVLSTLFSHLWALLAKGTRHQESSPEASSHVKRIHS